MGQLLKMWQAWMRGLFLAEYAIVTAPSKVRRSMRGASLVEYSLLLALIAVVAIALLITLGGKVRDTFDLMVKGFQGAGK